MSTFEIEIKSLLGSPEEADRVRNKMKEVDGNTTLHSHHKQLNHYFVGGDIQELYKKVEPLFSEQEQKNKLARIVEEGREFSIRSRQIDDQVMLVLKASIDDSTSDNGISRMEFEEPVNKTLDELDELITSAGYDYQAKWSREREEYTCKDTTVCLDKNAGYGYVAEFEQMVEDGETAEEVKKELYALMNELGVEELPQDRLARMFEYYNANWPEYYGTDKIFVVE